MEVPVYNLSGVDSVDGLKKLMDKVRAVKKAQIKAHGKANLNSVDGLKKVINNVRTVKKAAIKAHGAATTAKNDGAKIAEVLRNAASLIEEQAKKYQIGTLSGAEEGLGKALKKAGAAVKKAAIKATPTAQKVVKKTAIRAVKNAVNNAAKVSTNGNINVAYTLFNAANYIKAVADMYDKGTIKGRLQGIYKDYLENVKAGLTPSRTQTADARKARVLLSLEGIDSNGYRLAGLLMPYVKDIDEKDGGYIFEHEQIANVAAISENALRRLEENPNHTEEQLGKLFKKIGKALKKAAKAVAKPVVKTVKAVAKTTATVAKAAAKTTAAAVKSTANAVKATANVVKAGVQAATGNTAAAKKTMQKAGQQAKSAVVDPVKTAAKQTANVVKETAKQTANVVKATVIDPTKAVAKAVAKTIKIAGKIFKVIFIKINPVTVLMRNALRGLVALNFVGMATRLNVANMTKDEAIKAGYTEDMWNSSNKAKNRVVKFFVHMGGKKENIEKAIRNGAKRKALFKKDYKPTQKINENSDGTEATLGEPVTIGSALAAVGSFFLKIWQWIKKIIPKVANVAKKVGEKLKNATGGNNNAETTPALPQDSGSGETTEEKETNIKPFIIGGGLLIALLFAMNSSKKN